MSRTIRAYNKLNYFRRIQQEYEFRWMYIPSYHPYKQNSYSYSNFKCWDLGWTKRGLSKQRRIWYRKLLLTEIGNI